MVSQITMVSIIDDDESVRVATGSLVRSMGFATSLFGSAETFLASAQLDETACLITDVQMPGMTGVALQRLLHSRRPGMPVIFITAFPDERIRKQVQAAGAFGLLIKPFDANVLIRHLEAALKGGRIPLAQ